MPKFLWMLMETHLIFKVFRTSQKFLPDLDNFKTSLTDKFMEGLEVFEVGNLVYGKQLKNGKHHIL